MKKILNFRSYLFEFKKKKLLFDIYNPISKWSYHLLMMVFLNYIKIKLKEKNPFIYSIDKEWSINNKIFIANSCEYLSCWRVSIVTYVIIYCKNLNVVTMFYQNLVVNCWKMITFIIILSKFIYFYFFLSRYCL